MVPSSGIKPVSPALEAWSQPLNRQRSPCISYYKSQRHPSRLALSPGLQGLFALSVEGKGLPLLLGESGSGLGDCSRARQGAGEAWNLLGVEGFPGWQGGPSLAAEARQGKWVPGVRALGKPPFLAPSEPWGQEQHSLLTSHRSLSPPPPCPECPRPGP